VELTHGEGITVSCVLRSGGQYGPEHVQGLRAQAAHWLPGARFVCLSDVEVPCERAPLETDWPGWWAKIELFRHFKGRTLYLDLDSVIVADPLPLITGEFTMIANWAYPRLFASGVMSWDGDYSHITRAFEPVAEQVMREYVTLERWGDQAFIAEHAGKIVAFPGSSITSYRLQILRKRMKTTRPPPWSKIVAFNGTCVPWKGPEWARRWWPALGVAA
jgi:hypothetical protein